MTAIINRTPTGRLISLHTEIKYLKARYGDRSFELKGLKYDANANYNPLMFFPLKESLPTIGDFDPYLNNPLSQAKFHLTQSIQYDAQKSKSASECLNALEALGWVVRDGNTSKLTSLGLKIAAVEYSDKSFIEITRNCVLGYGVFVGLLYKCHINQNKNSEVTRSKIEIGYQNTHETVNRIPLSTGSQKDTIVRTRSTLFAWAITTGFAYPSQMGVPSDLTKWHVEALKEIRKKHWGWNKLKVFIPDSLFTSKHFVSRPLSYKWMTKSTKALRERGQSTIRESSMGLEEKVKNRRIAIVYSLALASNENCGVNFQRLLTELLKYEDLFVVNPTDFIRVMSIEIDIAIVSGIPYKTKNNILEPLTRLDLDVLLEEAPKKVISAVQEAYVASRVKL